MNKVPASVNTYRTTHIENGVSQTYYWWSAQEKPPFISGRLFYDWNGPFASLEGINGDIVARFGRATVVNQHPVERTASEEPQSFWPEYTKRLNYLVTLPLDEFVERAVLGAASSSEFKELMEMFQAHVVLRSDAFKNELLILSGSCFREFALFDVKRDEACVILRIPVSLHYRSPVELSSAELRARLLPVVTLEELSDDIWSVTLAPQE